MVRGMKELVAWKAKIVGVAAVVGGDGEASAVQNRSLSERVCRRLPPCQVPPRWPSG